jgi:hypothetical protein
MRFNTKIQFTTDLSEPEKDYVNDALISRMYEYFSKEFETVAQVATKFCLDGKGVCLFATSYRNEMDEVMIIGVETKDLVTAKYLQDEFHESMREFAEEGSEFSSSWINPELN